jgi:hypothetical protein
MAMLPARRIGHSPAVIDPTREFEDIYDRMGQLMNIAFGAHRHRAEVRGGQAQADRGQGI